MHDRTIDSVMTDGFISRARSVLLKIERIESAHRPSRGTHTRDVAPPVPQATEPPCPERGVYLEDIPAPGETWYKVVHSSGKVGIIHLPNELVDAGLYQNLCRRLDLLDPLTTLRAI